MSLTKSFVQGDISELILELPSKSTRTWRCSCTFGGINNGLRALYDAYRPVRGAMKFSLYLQESSVPEWRFKYINYKLGKKKLKSYKKQLKSTRNTSTGDLSQGEGAREYSRVQETLIDDFINQWVVARELDKCNEFYRVQLETCEKKFELLAEQLRIYTAKEGQQSRSYGATVAKKAGQEVGADNGNVVRRAASKAFVKLQELELIPSLPAGWQKHEVPRVEGQTAQFMESFSANHLTTRQIRHQLSNALIEFYVALQFLKKYRDINVAGFRKIVKKFDKICNTRELERFMDYANEHSVMFMHLGQSLSTYAKGLQKSNSLSQPPTNTRTSLESDPLSYWEYKVSEWYSDTITNSTRDRKNHLRKLRDLSLQYSLNEHIIHRTNTSIVQMFLGGGLLGIGVVFVVYSLYLAFRSQVHSFMHSVLLPLWGGCYLIVGMYLLYCVNCFIWFKTNINYHFIMFGEIYTRQGNVLFNNDFSTTRISSHVYVAAVALFVCSSLALPSFLTVKLLPWIWIWFGVGAIGLLIPWSVIPYWNTLRKTRRCFVVTFIRLIFSGAYPVQFADFFLGDIVCSLTYSVADVAMLLCVTRNSDFSQCGSSHLWSMGLLSSLPSYWRFMQCVRRYLDSENWFPHLLNAGKYICGIIYNSSLCLYRIEAFGTRRRNSFIVVAIINSIYTSIWDLVMDWSLFQPRSSNLFLRDDLYLAGRRNCENGTYSKIRKSFYYLSMVLDVIIRFEWIVYVIFPKVIQQNATPTFIMAALEIFRRFIWIIFRIENEHVANVHLFKITREAPLPYPVISRLEDHDVLYEDTVLTKPVDSAEATTNTIQIPDRSNKRKDTTLFDTISYAHTSDYQRPVYSRGVDSDHNEEDDNDELDD